MHVKKPFFSARKAKLCLQWCREGRHWAFEDWKRVMWSDESSYPLFCTDSRRRIWREPLEAMNPSCFTHPMQGYGGSIMIWEYSDGMEMVFWCSSQLAELQSDFQHLPWKQHSLDLNALENVWDVVKRRYRQNSPLPSNLQDLKSCIVNAWYSLEVNALQKHVDWMTKRIRASIRAKSGVIKY
ncbi:uncharacterized protein TNCV_1226291 [Trichonephila clavipes]|nr:uncharacterized protein TNCV_1226291 [Trichonephila clavipes]